MSNSIDNNDEELRDPEEIHFPVFGSGSSSYHNYKKNYYKLIIILIVLIVNVFCNDVFLW